jgi:hypothetical protein
MPEDQKTPTAETTKKNTGHKFQPGHQRFGGRKKKTAAAARAMAVELGIDPLQFMMTIIHSDTIEQTVIGEDGKKKRVEVAISLDMRLDAAKAVVGYLYPKLTAQQISGPGDGPIEVAGFDMTKLLSTPEAVEAAQRLALLMAEQNTPPAICGPAILPRAAAGYDLSEAAPRDHNGHYLPK